MDAQMRPVSELERLERRMERKWYDLAMAEQRGQPPHVLERMYNAYLKALDDYLQYQQTTGDPGTSRRRAS
jgi:hypothetical protein